MQRSHQLWAMPVCLECFTKSGTRRCDGCDTSTNSGPCRMLRLLRKEGMGPTAWDTLWAAAAYLAAAKQRGPAVEWAARAAECAAFALGEDSAEYEEYAAAAAKGANGAAPTGRLKR